MWYILPQYEHYLEMKNFDETDIVIENADVYHNEESANKKSKKIQAIGLVEISKFKTDIKEGGDDVVLHHDQNKKRRKAINL
jgi:hypothetical protein